MSPFFFIVYIVMPVLCSAKIKIKLTLASNKADLIFEYSGYDSKLITDKEVNLFNVTDINLKRGARVELGKVPDHIFLKDPTTYGDVYKNYKWREVNRNLRVNDIIIKQLIKEKVGLKGLEIINNTTAVLTHKINIFDSVENLAFSSWQDEGLPTDDINYEVLMKFLNGDLKYENGWRNETIRGVTLPLGVTNEGNLRIDSGQTVVLKLNAIKVFLLLKVTYVADLVGSVVANFAHTYGKYHFWAPSIGKLMTGARIKNSIKTNEYIEVRFFTDPKLSIYDKDTGKVVHTDKQLKLLRNRLILRPAHKFDRL